MTGSDSPPPASGQDSRGAEGPGVVAKARGLAQWWGLRTVGRLSFGVAQGFQHGFASAASLEHLYANRPAGTTALGRWVDRVYLRSAGANALRWRQQAVRDRIVEALEALHAQTTNGSTLVPTNMLELGGGAEPAALHALEATGKRGIEPSVVLVDRDPDALARARARIGVQPCVKRIGLNCADVNTWTADGITPGSVDLAVTSGLLELLTDAQLQGLASKLARLMKPSGTWVVTTMPAHPDLALVRRCLARRNPETGHAGHRGFSLRSCDALAGALRKAGWVVSDWRVSPSGIAAVGVAALEHGTNHRQ